MSLWGRQEKSAGVEKQREELQALPPKKKWLGGGGRKAAVPSVEEEVVLWIDEMRAENQQITQARIEQKALSIARSRGETDFTASRGWLERFLGDITCHCAE